jgi:hypothetical protein
MEERVTTLRPKVSMAGMRAKRKHLTVDTDYGPVTLTYRPGAIDSRAMRHALEAEKDPTVIVPLISQMVQSWDIVETEDGPPVDPANVELVEQFDIILLGTLVRAIYEDMAPGKPSATGSFGG